MDGIGKVDGCARAKLHTVGTNAHRIAHDPVANQLYRKQRVSLGPLVNAFREGLAKTE